MKLSESFARTGFAQFMNCTTGRVTRIVAGLALIAWGTIVGTGSTAGLILIAVGLVPLVAGVFNLCLISAMLGGPIDGTEVARRKNSTAGNGG